MSCSLRSTRGDEPSAKPQGKDLKETIDAASSCRSARQGGTWAYDRQRRRTRPTLPRSLHAPPGRAQREQEKSKVLASKVSEAPIEYDDTDLLDG